MTSETDVALGDGRTLHVYDARPADVGLTVIWHHGTPNVGEPPEPLFEAAAERGMGWVSYDRPAYGGSSRRVSRDVASAASDVAAISDALGIERFAVMGHSGGGTHALACAALLPARVLAAVCLSGLAPRHAAGLDYFAGMAPAGEAQLRAALAGRAALEAYYASTEFDPEQFTEADFEALSGVWGWMGRVAGKANEAGTDGAVDDNLAYVAPWGFDPGVVSRPVLLVQGGRDRIVPAAHGRWLAARSSMTELWLLPEDGHISILNSAVRALDWLHDHVS